LTRSMGTRQNVMDCSHSEAFGSRFVRAATRAFSVAFKSVVFLYSGQLCTARSKCSGEPFFRSSLSSRSRSLRRRGSNVIFSSKTVFSRSVCTAEKCRSNSLGKLATRNGSDLRSGPDLLCSEGPYLSTSRHLLDAHIFQRDGCAVWPL
jgi:hypothetical protein